MGDNNIETIDLNKPGIIDMDFFIRTEEQAKAIMKTCEAAINIIGKSVREMVNLAGLDSVDFALFNISAVKQNIEENPNKLPGLMIFAGSDDTYFQLNKEIKEDPEYQTNKAKRQIARFIDLHETNIMQRVEIIIEYFRTTVMTELDGQAKAMVITASREAAVKYRQGFEDYLTAPHR